MVSSWGSISLKTLGSTFNVWQEEEGIKPTTCRPVRFSAQLDSDYKACPAQFLLITTYLFKKNQTVKDG